MRQVILLLFGLVAIVASSDRLFAQSDACGDPTSTRIAVVTILGQPQVSDTEVVKRTANTELRFQKELIKRLALDSNHCVLRDTKVFDEPENYPALRGSTLFEIRASTSFKNPERSAIAVDMIAVQGPYIEQGIHLSFLPVLIESDADFSTGAKAVIDDWTRVGEALRQWAKEKTLEKKTAPPLK